MTIGSSISRVSLACDGVTKVFPIAIQAYTAADFTVILTAPVSAGGGEVTLTLNSDYSLATSGTLAPPAWTLTTLPATAYLIDYTLQVFVNPVVIQQTSYVQGQPFPSLAVQTNFDRLTQMVQRLTDQYSRTLHAPDGDVAPAMQLASAATRANTAQLYDANGNPAFGVIPETLFTQSIFNAFLAAAWGASPPTAQTAAELAAGVMPVNPQYLSTPHDIRRYGAVMDGVADDSSAWAQLALVIGAGGSGYIPPLKTMIKSQVTIVAPAYQRVALSGYGATVLTTGAIYGLTVTGGFMGGLDIMGLLFDNTTDSLCISSINFFGCQNCYAIDCWNRISSTIVTSSGYALVIMQPSDPTNDNTGAFWNKVLRCGTRQSTGNPSFYGRFGVLLSGACNATEIAGCNFVSVNQGVGIYNQITGGGTGTLANAANIHDNTFESVLTGVLVNGQSFAGSHIEGLRIIGNRFEAATNQAYLFQGLTNDSAVPTVIRGNFYVSSTPKYVAYSAAAITVNTDDPSITPSYPTAITFTAPPTGTSGSMTAAWPGATGQWQINFSDAETLQGSFINGSGAVTWPTALSGTPTVDASVVFGNMTDITSQGPQNIASIAGDAQILTAPTGYGLAGGISSTHNYRLRSRVGGGGILQFPNLGDLEGIDGVSKTAGVRRKTFVGTATFAASATVVVTITAEPDTNYMVFPEGNPTTGPITVSAKGTTGFTLTAANSQSQTVPFMLVGR